MSGVGKVGLRRLSSRLLAYLFGILVQLHRNAIEFYKIAGTNNWAGLKGAVLMPNPSIEQTCLGKPSHAAHVNR